MKATGMPAPFLSLAAPYAEDDTAIENHSRQPQQQRKPLDPTPDNGETETEALSSNRNIKHAKPQYQRRSKRRSSNRKSNRSSNTTRVSKKGLSLAEALPPQEMALTPASGKVVDHNGNVVTGIYHYSENSRDDDYDDDVSTQPGARAISGTRQRGRGEEDGTVAVGEDPEAPQILSEGDELLMPTARMISAETVDDPIEAQPMNVNHRKTLRRFGIASLLVLVIAVAVGIMAGTAFQKDSASSPVPGTEDGNGQGLTDGTSQPPPLLQFESKDYSWQQLGDTLLAEGPEGVVIPTSNDEIVTGDYVSLSGDGSTLAVTSYGFDDENELLYPHGIVRMYHWNNGQWNDNGQIVGDVVFQMERACVLSLSNDGTRIAVGAQWAMTPDNGVAGIVRVYRHQQDNSDDGQGGWVQLGSQFLGESPSAETGHSVAISSDGTTLTFGSPQVGVSYGTISTYRFDPVGGDWIPLGPDISGSIQYDEYGSSVALSHDGNILLAGTFSEFANILVYERENDTWQQVGDGISGVEMTADFELSVALSADGKHIAYGLRSSGEEGDGRLRVLQRTDGDQWVSQGPDIPAESLTDGQVTSVVLSADGRTVAVGMKLGDTTNGENSGRVRVYRFMGGDSNPVWQQLGVDLNGRDPDNFFGTTLSLSADGSMVAIGAPSEPGRGDQSGTTQVFRLLLPWNQVGSTLIGSSERGETSLKFGESVALSSDGSTMVVGTPGVSEVNVYRLVVSDSSGNGDGDSASEWARFGATIQGESWASFFGGSVAVSADGNTVVIGDRIVNLNSGLVRVFRWIENDWTQVGDDISGQTSSESLGSSVAISSDGNTIVVAARGYASVGKVCVYAFNKDMEEWKQVGQDIFGRAGAKWFGVSVSVSADGSTVAVGDGAEGGVEAVQVFEFANSWIPKGNPIEERSSTVSLSANGKRVAVAESNFGERQGHVRVLEFSSTDNDWIQLGSTLVGRRSNDYFGESISLSNDGSVLAVGAPGYDASGGDGSGQVSVFVFTVGDWYLIGKALDGETTEEDFGDAVSLSVLENGNVRIAASAPDFSSVTGKVRVHEQPSN